MANFRLVDRESSFLLPPSVGEWLPEDHLVRFVVEVTDQLDVSVIERQYTLGASDAAVGHDLAATDPGGQKFLWKA